MTRNITVKGTGKLSIAPDQIIISMLLKADEVAYDHTMEEAAEQLDKVRKALIRVGFTKEDIKTTDFNVGPNYKRFSDHNGNYKQTFVGFECSHRIKVEFDRDMERLAKVLHEITHCFAEPEFSIQFSVKDKDAVAQALLADAVTNAKEKADILAKAAGVTLGDILTVDYNWGELHMLSKLDYSIDGRCCSDLSVGSIDIEPDDIDLSDTVTVVWEIK